ncbi:hypothetical protein MKW92_042941 [Papaver armeniacum]|nr:hypothetical protein MKW92_042941 [Papaver armeniacum]
MKVPYTASLTTLFSYGLLFAFGRLRDLFRNLVGIGGKTVGYAPFCLGFEDFYGVDRPDSWIDVVERYYDDDNKKLKRTMNTSKCLNLGSYNYLGFAASDEYCTPCCRVIKEIFSKYMQHSVDGGTTILHAELEECVAKFVGKPAAMVTGMGYVTNSAILPVLISKGGLIISDSLNHNSIVNGARVSGAILRLQCSKLLFLTVFMHQIVCVFHIHSAFHLEEVLREQIAFGQPRTHRPWKNNCRCRGGYTAWKESSANFPDHTSLQEIQGIYLLIWMGLIGGAVGKSGRGVCELLGVETADEVIEYLKFSCPAHLYGTAISPPAATDYIFHKGAQKLTRIRENSNIFRSELLKMEFQVLGDIDSPVMPIMLYNPAKIPAFSRECLKRNVAVVVVSFPFLLLLAGANVFAYLLLNRKTFGDLVGVKYFLAEPKKQDDGRVKPE